ncbi:MAG: hypothetical protein HOL58_01445 [Francisellaceae bacterium]|nr:hypothetical protein [Francisellaceae bacterium]
MKLNRKIFVSFLSITFFTGSPSTYAAVNLDLYTGASLNKNTYEMKEQFGGKVFKENPTSLEFFIGHTFSENWFGEFSYEQSSKNHRTNALVAGDYYPGAILIFNGEFSVLNTQYQLKQSTFYAGYNLPLDGYIQNLEAFAALGLSWSKITAQLEVIDDEFPGLPAQADIELSKRTFKERKLIPSIRLGATYKLYDTVKVRCTGTWRNLSRLQPKSSERADLPTQIKIKNSMSFGIGLQVSI